MRPPDSSDSRKSRWRLTRIRRPSRGVFRALWIGLTVTFVASALWLHFGSGGVPTSIQSVSRLAPGTNCHPMSGDGDASLASGEWELGERASHGTVRTTTSRAISVLPMKRGSLDSSVNGQSLRTMPHGIDGINAHQDRGRIAISTGVIFRVYLRSKTETYCRCPPSIQREFPPR